MYKRQAIELDKSTSIPVIPELGVTDKTEKNTKTHDSANAGEPPVALKGSMTIGQGSLSSGQKQSHGAGIRHTTTVAKEAKECCKKCGSYEHTTEECKATNEEIEKYQQSLQEISPDLALKASKAADVKRGKLAAAGDKEGAAKKNAQAGRLYKAQAKKRLNREETEIIDDLVESGLFSDEEIQAILDLEEE